MILSKETPFAQSLSKGPAARTKASTRSALTELSL
jgi:hypothetical protein